MNRDIIFRVKLIEKIGSKREFINHYTIEQLITGSMWCKERYDHEILGQFSGLIDKNSVDIYEGDILDDGGVVEYFTDLKWDGLGSNHPGFYCSKWFLHNEEGEMEYSNRFLGKNVIGNIHENPELLK